MKTVHAYLNNSSLSHLLNRASIIAQANRHLQDLLPQNLKNHCIIANFDQHQIIIAISSAAFMPSIQSMQSWLHQNLKAFHPLKNTQILKISVMPDLYPHKPEQKTFPTLTANTQKLIQQTAKRIKDDKLRDALTRLSL